VTDAGGAPLEQPAGAPLEQSVRIDRVEITTASETGATHRQRNRGCDDAVGWSGADGGSVVATVAIADGHSDPHCVRSKVGADLVVAAATTMPHAVVGPDAITEAFIADWRRRVDRHLADNPLTEADLDAADRVAAAELSAVWAANPRMAYGTTALLCRITHEAITVVRVGDGDVIAVAGDGRASRLAVPEQRSGNLTESISQSDAHRAARCAEIAAAAAPVLLLLATDGFDNAYPADESMLRAAGELAALRRDSGRPIGSEVLRQWAREAADTSGDDATVAAVWIETDLSRRPDAREMMVR
jgi:serine/threonine protein phosphatase PrpC